MLIQFHKKKITNKPTENVSHLQFSHRSNLQSIDCSSHLSSTYTVKSKVKFQYYSYVFSKMLLFYSKEINSIHLLQLNFMILVLCLFQNHKTEGLILVHRSLV